jgi:hypothetical protein
MGKCHFWSFMVGRYNILIVYDPREWRIADDRFSSDMISLWYAVGPIEIRTFNL